MIGKSKIVFNISTGAVYPAMDSSFKHGYGANLRFISAEVSNALNSGKLTVERLRGFFFLAQRNGNPNADASILLKKKEGELENREVKAAPADPTPTDADIQSENERKAAAASNDVTQDDGAGVHPTVVDGETFPIDLAMRKLQEAGGDLSKLGMDDLMIIAESVKADTKGCKSKTEACSKIQKALESVFK